MDFKTATDRLTSRITHEELAEALGVSVASIRQARLAEHAAARRTPPPQWPGVVAELAEERGREFLQLAKELRDVAAPIEQEAEG